MGGLAGLHDDGAALASGLQVPADVLEELALPLVWATLVRERWYWYDKEVAAASRYMRLSYQPLTRRWRLLASPSPIGNAGLSLRLKLLLQLGRIAGKDEAKGYPALLADGGMVELVRLDQPLGIAALGHPAEIALVDQAIVHQRVDDPVKQHAKADPGARLPRLCPHDPRAAQREH